MSEPSAALVRMVRVHDDVRSQWAGFTLKVVEVGQMRGGRRAFLVVMPDGGPNGWFSEAEVEVVR